jgi:L-ribulokinase
MGARYAVGVDFGTESGRAVLVEVATGRELATAVYAYRNGVIDEHLPAPDDGIRLPPEWALQDPEDYIRTFQTTVPRVLAESGVDPADVIGVGMGGNEPSQARRIGSCFSQMFGQRPHRH